MCQFAFNSPLNQIDPEGLDVLVIVNGPLPPNPGAMGALEKYIGNPFGHTAIGFTGHGVYSFGNAVPYGSSMTNYLQTQANLRNSTIYHVVTTPDQDAKMIEHLLSMDKSVDIPLYHNCAYRVKGALDQLGIKPPGIYAPWASYDPPMIDAAMQEQVKSGRAISIRIPIQTPANHPMFNDPLLGTFEPRPQ